MKKYRFFLIYSFCLIIFSVYLLLDTFVISNSVRKVQYRNTTANISSGDIITNDKYYEDDNIKISINEIRKYDTTIYIADVVVNNSDFLKTAIAKSTYGKNVVDTASNIADRVGAILAINGDYYGVHEKGYVLRNGEILRNTIGDNRYNNEDLVIYKDSSWEIINENDVTLEKLYKKGAYNVLSFGPALVTNGKICVDKSDEVGRFLSPNPRTAMGLIDENHYVFVVCDGRSDESVGLRLYELAEIMEDLDCDIAYNLDGGGSTTMVFKGHVINKPTLNGRFIKERKVSDIVYFGY